MFYIGSCLQIWKNMSFSFWVLCPNLIFSINLTFFYCMTLHSMMTWWYLGALVTLWASLWVQMVKIYLQCRRLGFDPWVGKIPLEKGMAVFLPGESPWTEKPSEVAKSMGSQRVRLSNLAHICPPGANRRNMLSELSKFKKKSFFKSSSGLDKLF